MDFRLAAISITPSDLERP